jgi:hypothetical protein
MSMAVEAVLKLRPLKRSPLEDKSLRIAPLVEAVNGAGMTQPAGS